MAYRTLEINVISAEGLKHVNLISKMDVYAVVSISGDSSSANHKQQKTRTPVDRSGGSNPTWNFPIKFTIDESLAQQNRLCVDFKLRCDRVLGDKDIGEVNVPIKELLDSPGDGKSMQFVSYQVRKPSGKPKGELRFAYKFGDQISAAAAAGPVGAYPAQVSGPGHAPYGGHFSAYPPPSSVPYGGPVKADAPVGSYPSQGGYVPYGGPVIADTPVSPYPVQSSGSSSSKTEEPVTAYPAQPAGPSSGPYAAPGKYPPQPPPAGYPHHSAAPYGGYRPQQPPPPGYGYPPPPPPGYGYPSVQQPAKKNKLGMGLGAGLLGGMLGGLLIGDMVSDAGDCDMGGFDF